MDLRPARHDQAVLLHLSGRVDYNNAAELEAAMQSHLATCSADGDRLILDLSGLEYISSAGLRILMLASKKATPAGGKLALAAPQDVVREILEISRFQHVVPIYDSVDQARAALNGESGPN
ncbi:MAG: STAS domain-containing protein [Panacagrimonas sp.]